MVSEEELDEVIKLLQFEDDKYPLAPNSYYLQKILDYSEMAAFFKPITRTLEPITLEPIQKLKCYKIKCRFTKHRICDICKEYLEELRLRDILVKKGFAIQA